MKDFVIIELSSKSTSFYYHRDNADGGLSLKKGETDQQVLITAGADAVVKSAVGLLGDLFYGDKKELPVVVTFGIDVEEGNRTKVVNALRSNGYENTVEMDFDTYLFRSLHVSSDFAVVLSDNGRDAYARVFDLKHPEKVHHAKVHSGKGVDPRVQIMAKKMWESISQGEKYMLSEAKDMDTLRHFAEAQLKRDFYSPEIAENVVLSDEANHDVFYNMDDVNRLALEDKSFFKVASKQIEMEGVDTKSCEVIIRDASCVGFWKELFVDFYVQTMSEQKRMDVFELMADDAKAQEFDMLSFDKALQAKREAEKKKREAEEAKAVEAARKKKEEEEKAAREKAEKDAQAQKQQQEALKLQQAETLKKQQEEALKAEQAREAAKQQKELKRQQEDLRKQQEELKKQQEELKKQKEKNDVKVDPPTPDSGTQPSQSHTMRNIIVLLVLCGGLFLAYKFLAGEKGSQDPQPPTEIDYTSVKVEPSELSLTEGETAKLTVVGEPVDASEPITWSSKNTDVADVSSDGVVTAKKAGQVDIEGTTQRSGKPLKASVKVKKGKTPGSQDPEPKEPLVYTSISASPTSVTLNVGESRQIQLSCTPAKAKETISWASSDSNIATVTQNGYITAKSAGRANIFAVGEKSGVQSNDIHVKVNGGETVGGNGGTGGIGGTGGTGKIKLTPVNKPINIPKNQKDQQ